MNRNSTIPLINRRRVMRWLLTGTAVTVFAIVAWQAGWLSVSDPLQAASAMIILVLLFSVTPAAYVYIDATKYKQTDAAMEAFFVCRNGMSGLRNYINRRDDNFKQPL